MAVLVEMPVTWKAMTPMNPVAKMVPVPISLRIPEKAPVAETVVPAIRAADPVNLARVETATKTRMVVMATAVILVAVRALALIICW